jgi:REP element-mobilizing transposase RayT
MPRKLRPYCPGLAFHITSRVTGHEPLFDAHIRARMVEILCECVSRSDTEILAYAMMRNHLHLVVRQQQAPLSQLLQPVLCRIALLIRSRKGVEGHVFERVYRAKPCLSARHLRDAVVYTHLNPIRAGYADTLDACDSTSHRAYAYAGERTAQEFSCLTVACELFAERENCDAAQLHDDYRRYVEHRQLCDAADKSSAARPSWEPDPRGGDNYFDENFTRISESSVVPRLPKTDMRDIARDMICASHDGLPMHWLRGSRLASRDLQTLRARIIRQAAIAGHSKTTIAGFFAMSPNRVSELAGAVRPSISI